MSILVVFTPRKPAKNLKSGKLFCGIPCRYNAYHDKKEVNFFVGHPVDLMLITIKIYSHIFDISLSAQSVGVINYLVVYQYNKYFC